MLTVLVGLAESKRSLDSGADRRGTRSHGQGNKFGRKPKLTQHQIAETARRRDAGEALAELDEATT